MVWGQLAITSSSDVSRSSFRVLHCTPPPRSRGGEESCRPRSQALLFGRTAPVHPAASQLVSLRHGPPSAVVQKERPLPSPFPTGPQESQTSHSRAAAAPPHRPLGDTSGPTAATVREVREQLDPPQTPQPFTPKAEHEGRPGAPSGALPPRGNGSVGPKRGTTCAGWTAAACTQRFRVGAVTPPSALFQYPITTPPRIRASRSHLLLPPGPVAAILRPGGSPASSRQRRGPEP